MFIFSSFAVAFISLCHSVVFVLSILPFPKTENTYVSSTERLRERRKKKLNQMLIKKENVFIMHEKRSEFS